MTAIHPAFNIQALSLRESNENLDCSNNNETANSTTTNNISGIESTSSSVPGHNTLTKTQTNGSDTSTNTVKIHPHVAGYNFNLEPTQTNKENSTGGEVGFDSDHEMQSSSSTPMETITPSTPALLAQPSWSMEPLAHSSDNFTLQSSKNRDKAYFEDGSKLTQDMPPISSSGPRKALNAEVVELPSVVEHPEYPPFPAPNSQQSRHQHSNSQATSDTYTLQPSILASSNDTISNFPHSVSQPQIYSGRRQMSQSSQGHNRSQSQTNPPITIPPAHSSYVPPQSQPSSSYGFQNYTLQDLVDLDLRCQAALISVQQSRSKMLNTVVQGSVTYRLYAAVNGFFANVSLRESHDANKFANAFQTLLDTSNYLLKDECEIKYSPFSSTLRGHFRRLIESFVTLLKTAPTFVAAALLSMSTSDIENFVDGHASAISEAYPDVSSLNRTRPVDILFYTIFPSDVAVAQREEYFSQLLLPLISHKRGDSICFAVLDRFIDFDGHIYRKGLEFELLQILQSANCILNGKDTSNCKPKSSVDQLRSSPTTSRPRSPALAEQQSTVRPNGRRRAKTSSGPFPTASSQDVEDLKASQIIERAVESLLQYLANVNSSTIPDSLLRIVKHVVSKMDAVKKRGALLFFVVKYFFGQHVARLITHPERIGILENYYIAPRTRTKVLNAIAQRLQLCVTLYANGTELDNEIIHQYINEIYSRFEDAATHSVSLSPSQSSENVWGGDETFASPGQMVTLAPSDLVCLYTALFPSFALHQRSSSMNSHHLSAKKIRPSAMSYSTSSSISSSTPSRLDETQHAPDVDLQGQVAQPPPLSEIGSDASTSSPSYSPSIEFSPFGPTDDSEWSLEDIKSDLQPVMEELIRRYPYLRYKELSQMLYSLRPSKSQALRVPHPLSEKWQVYRMDDDGTMHELTTDSSCSSSMSGSKRESLVLTEDPLPVPQIYRPQMSIIRSAVEKLARANDATICVGPFLHVNFCLPSEQHMVNLLTACQRTSALNGNYVTSHEYSTALAAFKRLAALPGADSGSISAYIFNSIARAREERIGLAEQQLNEASEQARPQRLEIVRTREKTQDIIGQVGHIRTKIWYNTEVRTSGIWKRARDVSMTLTYGNDYVKQHLSATQKSPSTSGNSSLRGPGAPQLRRNSSTSSIASLAEFTFKRLTRRDSAKRHSMVNVGGDRSGSAAPTVTVVESSSGNSCSSMLMFAPQELAGPFKLNDKESAATTKWLEGQQIQNFCNGEERIHRFCCEIDDLLKRIMGDTMTSRKNRGQSMLSSSALFRSDLWSCIIELEGTNRGSNSQLNLKRASMIDITADSFRGNMHLKGHRSSMSNVLDIFSALDSENLTSSGTLSKFSPVSGGHRRNVSDAGTVASNIWDSEITEQSEPSSPTPETRGPSSAEKEELRNKLEQMLLDVQMTLTGLLYTDLGTSCFGEDKWINSPIMQQLSTRDLDPQKNLQAAIRSSQSLTLKLDAGAPNGKLLSNRKSRASLKRTEDENVKFDFNGAFKKMLQQLSVVTSPLDKLQVLHDLEVLVVEQLTTPGPAFYVPSTPGSIRSGKVRSHKASFSSETIGLVPNRSIGRTVSISGLTSLGGAIATAEARRSSSGQFNVPRTSLASGPNTDTIVEELRRIFRNSDLRASTLFRDLQFIAAFVPPHVLDLTNMGKAFWDVSLAALSFKEEVLNLVVDFAAEIFQYKTGMIGPHSTSDTSFLEPYDLSNCAQLWTIASKEGDIGGQRELAIMHMSHPNLTPIALTPFARISDVFDVATLEHFTNAMDIDKDKFDPVRMAVIQHWMTNAAAYGDAIASEYLSQQGSILL